MSLPAPSCGAPGELPAPATSPGTPALVRYALGSAGMGVYVTVPGLLLLYFLTDTLGVSPWLAGLVLLVPKVVDVVLHPFVGFLSDADRVRRGSRLRLLAAGCALGPAFVALFAVPGPVADRPWAAALWVAGWFVVGNTLFAAYQVPYLATPTDMDVDYDGRTRVLSFRMVVLTLGILVGGAVAPLLVGDGEPTVAAYALMALVLGAFTLAFQLVGVGGVRRLVPPRGPASARCSAPTRTSACWPPPTCSPPPPPTSSSPDCPTTPATNWAAPASPPC